MQVKVSIHILKVTATVRLALSIAVTLKNLIILLMLLPACTFHLFTYPTPQKRSLETDLI